MAHLFRDVVNDIVVNLKQVYDDKPINETQVAYWVLLVGNRLKSQHINKRESGAFLNTFPKVPVLTGDGITTPKGRKYIELPTSIYDFDNDKGINYISYCADDCEQPLNRVLFSRTSPSALSRLSMSSYEKPRASNPFFYRSGNKIYLMGIECVETTCVELGLYSALDPVTEICLDEPFDFPEELLVILQRQVIDLGRFVLMIPEERVNDGDNTIYEQGLPTQKISSVNDLNTNDK